MNIIVNTSIREKYMSGFPRPGKVTEIVIHGTGGGSTSKAIINWIMGGERAKEYLRGVALFHYLIDREGGIIEVINPSKWVYHSSSGIHDKETIGIEHINPDAKNQDAFTDEQYQSDLDLILFLITQFPVTSIIGHVQNTLKYSGQKYVKVPCPGNYDWPRLQKMLFESGHEFNFGEEHLINRGLI